jgi:beta-glucosidase
VMVSADWKRCLHALRDAVTRGAIPMDRVDDAVRRILDVKARSGLLDRPRPSERPAANDAAFGGLAHRALAREAVRRSLVLLKNAEGLLPLRRDARVLVAGRNANDRGHQCGGFSIAWQGTSGNDAIEGGTSIWEGIRDAMPNAQLAIDGAGADRGLYDAAIVVVGEKPYAEGMGDIRDGARVASGAAIGLKTAELAPYGPSLALADLHPEDLATIERIAATGVPVVTVLVSGRPLVVERELAASTAFVAAWLPGSEGQGVADVLLGDFDFEGRLSFTWPAESSLDPLAGPARFPRGFGLSCA